MSRKYLFCVPILWFTTLAFAAPPQLGDVIINEFYWHTLGGGPNHFEAVELLVVADKVNLNNLLITDCDKWNGHGEDHGVLNDQGKGVLSSLRSGTLVVVYDGHGDDVIDPEHFLIKIFAQSSPYCDVHPTGHVFRLNDKGDNIHIALVGGPQLDFIKYASSDNPGFCKADPGSLHWVGGKDAVIDVGAFRDNTGTRYTGDTAEGNDDPKNWQSYPMPYTEDDNLGKPNGGKNTTWIESLRAKAAPWSPPPATQPALSK